MKALVIFDTTYGNTKQISEAIARVLGTQAVHVDEASVADLTEGDLLVVGSPINAWRPTEKMLKFLAEIGEGQLNGVKAAAFDTRVKLFIHGDAAKKIAASLKKAGAEIVAEPMAFTVKGMEGPLFEDEIARAEAWAKQIKER